MLRERKRAAIIELQMQGYSLRNIARSLTVSRITVKRIVDSGNSQVPKIVRPTKAEQFRSQIQELYTRCRGNLSRVHKELKAVGAQLSYSALTSFVRRNHLADIKSNVTRSITAAQQWMSEISHGARSLEILNTEADDPSDLVTLLCSLRNGRVRERKKAATILARKCGIPIAIISAMLHSPRTTTRCYFRLYSTGGISALFAPSPRRSKTKSGDPQITTNILEILHQKPILFGINRTGWTQRELVEVYKERYKQTISRCTLAKLIKSAGYSWRKARRVLSSPDPHYREKVELLVKILSALTKSESLFFLDEWGPVQVRKRGGKAYSAKDNIPKIPRHQTSRGTVALVAALSATTNQLTWTFVTSKDSRSMMNLLEILYNQYHAQSKLYVTWDAVSWHNSTSLTEWLDQFNETNRKQEAGPIIELIPLPTSAQFLNVIEGVLSGMTRAVINNSDYGSPDDMKLAISRHFTERNKHFKDNPRRAGKAIWEADFFHGLNAFGMGD